MNKSDLINDARKQLRLAMENLAAGNDSLAIGNLYEATHQIARFSGCLKRERAPKVPAAKPGGQGIDISTRAVKQLKAGADK